MNNRLLFLDSIRGIAALMVVVAHTIEMSVEYSVNAYFLGELYNSIDIGRLGVVIFFLLSGFVIPMSLKKRNGREIVNFGIKRFFRLYPVYWFSILFAVFIGVGVGIEIIDAKQVLMNFTMIHKFLGYESVISAYWTLHLELVFYFLCAFVFKLGVHDINRYGYVFAMFFMIVAIALGMLRYYYGIKIPVVMGLGLSCMFIGAYFSYLLSINDSHKYFKIFMLIGLFLLLLYVTHIYYYKDGWVRWYLCYVFAFLIFFLMVTLYKVKNKFFVFLGDVSYSMYLLHSVVIGFVFLYFSKYFDKDSAFVFLITMVMIFSVVISYMAYKFVEVPFQNIGGKVIKVLEKNSNERAL